MKAGIEISPVLFVGFISFLPVLSDFALIGAGSRSKENFCH
jgi:hypothetical protein